MASPVEVQLILCDAAVADPTGKIHMLGAGWSITTSPTAPQAVAMLIKVPWDRANQKIPMSLGLRDSDGRVIRLGGPDGERTVLTTAEIEVGRPAGLPPGSSIDASFALNVSPMPLIPGRYEWHLDISDQTFSAFFTVRSAS